MSKVLTEQGEVKKLTEIFNVSRVTVTNALAGRTNSDLATRIRFTAMQRGGRLKGEETIKQL